MKNLKYLLLFAFVVSAFCGKSIYKPYQEDVLINGDFEEGTEPPAGWNVSNPYQTKFITGIDAENVFSGQRCIKIENLEYYDDIRSYYYQNQTTFPKGKELEFSAYVKTVDVTIGSAAVILQAVDHRGNVIDFESTSEYFTINGSNSWRKYSVKKRISPEAVRLDLVLYHQGNGTVWFDNASLIHIK
ncbi:hypothetical protein ACFL4T_00070 [candidate division KSB1 bacterium]